MRLKIVILLLTFLTSLSSCLHTEKVSTKFNSLLNNPVPDSSNINFDGAYTDETGIYHNSTEFKNGVETKFANSQYLKNPFFFFKNGMVLTIQADYFLVDSSIDQATKLKIYGKWENGNWGVYRINNDIVEAIIYMPFSGTIKTGKQMQTCFRGILRNRDSIVQWHMVAPYPRVDANRPDNKTLIEYLKTPKTLFISMIQDRHSFDPGKAWINELRTKP